MPEPDTSKHWWLYVLQLEDNKYYVGITTQTPEKRFLQHKNGFAGAAWAHKHKPIAIHDTKDLGVVPAATAEQFENKVVRLYIKKYGIDNVRGGDLRTTEKLVPRFGRYWVKDYWQAGLALLFLSAIILILGIKFVLK